MQLLSKASSLGISTPSLIAFFIAFSASKAVLFRPLRQRPQAPRVAFQIEARIPETPSALLVHLRTRRHTIDSHEKKLLGFYLPEQMLDVVEDGDKHYILRHSECRAIVILVRAVVDNAVHIQLIRRQQPAFSLRPTALENRNARISRRSGNGGMRGDRRLT